MTDRYMVISPDTLEAMRRAGHAAKLEVRIEKLEAELVRTFNNMMKEASRIEKLEAALRELRAMHHEDGINDLEERDCMTYVVICDALEENNDPAT